MAQKRKVKAKEKSFLERRSVQVPVEKDYRNRYLQFTTWSARANMSTSTVADIDEALTLLMNESFFEGDQEPMARKCSPPSDTASHYSHVGSQS